jgi:hypothetical protein
VGNSVLPYTPGPFVLSPGQSLCVEVFSPEEIKERAVSDPLEIICLKLVHAQEIFWIGILNILQGGGFSINCFL